MKHSLVFTHSYTRRAARFVRRHPELLRQYEKICAIPAEDLPVDIRHDFEWVVQKLSAAPALCLGKNIVKPSIDVSAEGMKNKTASIIAAKVATIEDKLMNTIRCAVSCTHRTVDPRGRKSTPV